MISNLNKGDKVRFLCSLDTCYGIVDKGTVGHFTEQRFSDVQIHVVRPGSHNSCDVVSITVRFSDIESVSSK